MLRVGSVRTFQAPRGSCLVPLTMKATFLLPHLHRGAAVPAARAGGSLLIAAVLARPLPVPVIKRVTKPARRQNASKYHQQGNDKRCPQDHRVYHDGVLFLHLLQTSRLPPAGTGVSGPYDPA